jgi:glutathione S-transferase
MKEATKSRAGQLRIYGVYRSRTSRVYWAADELGIDFESISVTLARSHPNADVLDAACTTRSPEFLEINPAGLVPVIDDDGLILRESLAITYYLARRYDGDLAPKTLDEEAKMLSWIFWVATEMEPLAVELLVTLEHSDGQPDAATIQRIFEKLEVPFNTLNDHLATREYVVGKRFTIADLNIAEVFRLTQSQEALFEAFPNVQAWIQRCQDRPAFARMMAGRQREMH